ncbi:MAG: type IV secretory system conjugative DNA transfer family protein [Pseudomonadota bacterium]
MHGDFGARFHAFIHGFFRKRDAADAIDTLIRLERKLKRRKLWNKKGVPQKLYEDVLVAVGKHPNIDPDDRSFLVGLWFVDHILEGEQFFSPPKIDWRKRKTIAEWWEFKTKVEAVSEQVDQYDKIVAEIAKAIVGMISAIQTASPTFFKAPRYGEEYEGDDINFTTTFHASLDNPKRMLDRMLAAGSQRRMNGEYVLPRFGGLMQQNLARVSGYDPTDPESYRKPMQLPSKSRIENTKELLQTYLGPTAIDAVFHDTMPFTLPEKTRFEHHHIVAGSGHGKTQTLQYLIAHDLEKVVRGDASVVVIDSQGDLIRNILELDMISEDNLVLIDPTDVDFPVCLNLFDVQMDRINAYSRLHREQMLNGILELYDFVLGALLGAEMTQKQSVIFRYVTRLLLHIPDATIHTMLELFQEGGSRLYAEHIKKLEGSAKRFFETEFDGQEFKATKRQVVRRLYGILENQTFNRMFSHPRSKLDLYSEMNAGKVILINTAKDLLKETGTEIFGRFFIAMIAQAAQERATLKDHERMPTFVYIDEAQEYFDQNIETILSQARKYNVGMVMAHQYLDQLSPRLQSAFMSNTSIKMAGGLSVKDARAFASEFRTDAEFIASQPKGSFATSIRGHTNSAVSLKIPFGHMESMEKHDWQAKEYVIGDMRHKYAVPIYEMYQNEKSDEETEALSKEEETSKPPATEKDKPKSKPKKKSKKEDKSEDKDDENKKKSEEDDLSDEL